MTNTGKRFGFAMVMLTVGVSGAGSLQCNAENDGDDEALHRVDASMISMFRADLYIPESLSVGVSIHLPFPYLLVSTSDYK